MWRCSVVAPLTLKLSLWPLFSQQSKGMAAASADELKNLSMGDGAAAPGAYQLLARGRQGDRRATMIEPHRALHPSGGWLRERA